MSSLQQHLADTAANLNAQLCELNELRERAGKALLSKSPQPKQCNGPAQPHGPHQKWTMNLSSASTRVQSLSVKSGHSR